MIKSRCIVVFAALILSSCVNDKEGDRNSSDASMLTGRFIFEVDRISNHPHVQLQWDELEESSYSDIDEVSRYDIEFSDNGETVTIEQNSLVGLKTLEEEDVIKYNLTEETSFAGGRFLVWKNDGDYEAELTIYGSGVPIISSERGNLIPTI